MNRLDWAMSALEKEKKKKEQKRKKGWTTLEKWIVHVEWIEMLISAPSYINSLLIRLNFISDFNRL
jgi:hypothetical protein